MNTPPAIFPQRIQLRRAAGYNLQATSIAANGLAGQSVVRGTIFGNPYTADEFGIDLALALYEQTLRGAWNPSLILRLPEPMSKEVYRRHCRFLERFKKLRNCLPVEQIRYEFKDKNPACFCAPDQRCHVDIILKLFRETC